MKSDQVRVLDEFRLSPIVAVIDVKTLGKKDNALIGSISCVIVNLVESSIASDVFYHRCHTGMQAGRSHDKQTLAFWQQQETLNPVAWSELYDAKLERSSLTQALGKLTRFIQRVFPLGTIPHVIVNDTDGMILANAYQEAELKRPWPVQGCHSLSTMIWLGRMFFGCDPIHTIPFEGFKYHGLYDVRHEAKVLLDVMDKMFSCTADFESV